MTVVMGFFVICAGVILLQTSKSAVLSEAMKKSKSTLSIRSDDGDDEKDELDPGPMELRAVPFDSIRQMGVTILSSSGNDTDPSNEQSPPINGLGPAVVLKSIEKHQSKDEATAQDVREKDIADKTAADNGASRNQVATRITSTQADDDEPSRAQLISTASTLREQD
ncbi:hypothetical protein BGZ72_006007 [Mortierella alpina]|nr:hypothetical protein BGZ72_006007 [Mortierella alpina]